jgi:hypothetical protein
LNIDGITATPNTLTQSLQRTGLKINDDLGDSAPESGPCDAGGENGKAGRPSSLDCFSIAPNPGQGCGSEYCFAVSESRYKCVMPTRRFPQPWSYEDHNDACYIVKDANGVAIAYVYYEQDHGRRTAANLMTRDEARRIAANIANLPELLKRPHY